MEYDTNWWSPEVAGVIGERDVNIIGGGDGVGGKNADIQNKKEYGNNNNFEIK